MPLSRQVQAKNRRKARAVSGQKEKKSRRKGENRSSHPSPERTSAPAAAISCCSAEVEMKIALLLSLSPWKRP